jgi:hypothetical protein
MGGGVASHAGSRLLADLAEVTGLSHAFREASSGLRQRAVRGMIRARVLVDLAVMLSDGGEAISDLAVLRSKAGSGTTRCWRSSTRPVKHWPGCCAPGQRRQQHRGQPHHGD